MICMFIKRKVHSSANAEITKAFAFNPRVSECELRTPSRGFVHAKTGIIGSHAITFRHSLRCPLNALLVSRGGDAQEILERRSVPFAQVPRGYDSYRLNLLLVKSITT